ncbi:MAG: DUF2829 domain-containing protein [Dehalococcoidia bacterium]|nr:DUF2829 domain-containing protein [Dehalococcoidia bacterium]
MNFSEALKAMKMGSKASRESWRGRISYWFMSEDANGESLIMEMKPNDDTDELVENVSLEEIFAEDWWIVT